MSVKKTLNGRACCVIGLCCTPAGLRRLLINELKERMPGLTDTQVADVADLFIEKTNFLRTMFQPLISLLRAKRTATGNTPQITTLVDEIRSMVEAHPNEPTDPVTE